MEWKTETKTEQYDVPTFDGLVTLLGLLISNESYRGIELQLRDKVGTELLNRIKATETEE
jgi:hypothetical protein